MRTPAGGDRSTQWVIQYRKTASAELSLTDDAVGAHTDGATPIPHRETLWTRHNTGEPLLHGPTARAALLQLRENTFGLEWRAIRVETVQRVEGW